MKKMLKRADGSTSQRGLWDNIRAKAAANKKAGKKGKAPSKDMLEQERKIKEMKMGGDWMQDSNELKFGGPSKPKKYQTGQAAEEDINFPTDAIAAPTFTRFTVGPLETDNTMGKKDNFITRTIDKISDRFSTIAGGGNKGGGSTAFNKSCLSGDCIDMMKSKGGNQTNRQNRGGAKGLSDSKQLARGRVMEKSAGQIELEQKRIDEQAAKKAEYEARRAANRIANKAGLDADIAKQNASTGVYANPRDLTPVRMSINKTGGKKKYFKK